MQIVIPLAKVVEVQNGHMSIDEIIIEIHLHNLTTFSKMIHSLRRRSNHWMTCLISILLRGRKKGNVGAIGTRMSRRRMTTVVVDSYGTLPRIGYQTLKLPPLPHRHLVVGPPIRVRHESMEVPRPPPPMVAGTGVVVVVAVAVVVAVVATRLEAHELSFRMDNGLPSNHWKKMGIKLRRSMWGIR